MDLLIARQLVVKRYVNAVLVEHFEQFRFGGDQGHIGETGGVLLEDLPTLNDPYPQATDAVPSVNGKDPF
jgi:hypothetical protein